MPADQAGVQVGDVIVRLDDKPVENTQQLRNRVADIVPGKKATLTIIRDGKERTVAVSVGTLDAAATTTHADNDTADHSKTYGLSVAPLTDRQASALGLEKETGVLISAVDNDSPAEAAGLRPGELIVEVNRERVANVDEFLAALRKGKESALLLVKTKDASKFVVLTTK